MFEVIAFSPPGFPSPIMAQAAHRAGHGGGVALEYVRPEQAKPIINTLIAAETEFTVSVGQLPSDLLLLLESAAPYGLKRVILCDSDRLRLEEDVTALREIGVQVLVQVTCLEDAERAEQLGADGLVVKGNESGGQVGEETTFILLQRIIPQTSLPVWARGGVGLRTAAACLAAGAAGVLLDWQLALCEESALPAEVKARVARMDGSETAILGQDCLMRYRVYARPGESAYFELREYEDAKALHPECDRAALDDWRGAVEARIGGQNGLLLIGQDAAFAAPLADKYRTVKGICQALGREARRQCQQAARLQALRPGGPLAESHGTRYPIVQGPMTRVSDRADFALAVAEGGGLPFLALALLRGPQVAKLLEETKRKLGDRPWGVGILGFVPKELREEQLAEVMKHPPPFALIAGGRPDQAKALEQDGIHTYLHVPSPELLRMFLKSGSRRVIFEGRECGGHVGPRTSFVLWELMTSVILAHLAETGDRGEAYHVLFAGGIHDARSAAMVTALAAPLSERGVRVGVLLGTSYLFTKEAVTSGAIVEGFQKEAIACTQTSLLESGVGHATRCASTPFERHFRETKQRLVREGRVKEEVREALETLNLGRLRIASKGITRGEAREGSAPDYVSMDAETQRRDGMYMIGQVAALREKVCSVEELHEEVSRAGEYLEAAAQSPAEVPAAVKERGRAASPADVAIIGISCMFPKAKDLTGFWHNILHKVNAITEVPKERWDANLYFDSDRRARGDKVYSKWGGFLDDVAFDPVRYGMPPNSVPSVEPLQLLVLGAVSDALKDAGYLDRPFDRKNTSVIFGVGGGTADLGQAYGFRSLLPYFMAQAGGRAEDAEELIGRLEGHLPVWTEDSFAGLLLNVIAGRVANRFDLGGTNYTVDAACASSLAALRLAVDELESGASNMAIVGGADTMQSPFAYLCFSKTQALSPTGQCKTYDESADGIVISEGIAIAVLKRLEDAVRDGDHVYAVIKSVGSSSDGKDKGLTAPRPVGQIHALERAYRKAGFSPETVGLIEAHGTGTVVGDRTEVESLTKVFRSAGAGVQSCALGSVKSMIGHTKCTAGIAGVVKAAMALSHKVLPPTIGITKPNSNADFPHSPLYPNTEPRPWIGRPDGTPRRAGVSAFGFGGTNFHAVLEEYVPARGEAEKRATLRDWPAEMFFWRGKSPEEITGSLDQIKAAIEQGAKPLLCDLAAAVSAQRGRGDGNHRLAVVATSLEDLVTKIESAKTILRKGGSSFRDAPGIYYTAADDAEGKVAFLFPGQGSQSVDMLRDLAVAYPGFRSAFEDADRSLGDALGRPLSEMIFPRPTFSEEERRDQEASVTRTDVAQPAMGAADMAMFRLLSDLGVQPAFVGGHSYGEYVALCAAGAVRFKDLIRISEARGRFIIEAAKEEPGTMAAINAGGETISPVVERVEGASIANLNAPLQTVVSGTHAAVAEVLQRLSAQGVSGRTIRVSCAFHSNLVAGAQEPLRRFLETVTFREPRVPVFSNTTARPHSTDPDQIRTQLVEHLVRPVRFADEVRAMYEAGARVFVEVGPGKVLTNLVERTLEGRSFLAVPTDQPGRHGLLQLVHAVAQLAAAGVKLHSDKLFEGRAEQRLDLARLVEQTKPAPPSPTTWMVNGARAVPINAAKQPAAPRLSEKPAPQNGREAASSPPAASSPSRTSVAPPPPRTSVPSSPREQTTLASNGHHPGANGRRPENTSAPTVISRPELPAAAPPTPGWQPQSAPPSPPPSNGRPGHPTNGAVGGNGVDATMHRYHQLMSKFLDTQRNIMLSYLQANGDAHPAADVSSYGHATNGHHATALPPPVIEAQATPSVPVSHATHTPEAETFAAMPPAPPLALTTTAVPGGQSLAVAVLPAPEPSLEPQAKAGAEQSPESPALTRQGLMDRLIGVVSERTGYPPEMLDIDADLEADLGIDSIKRVEILSALQSDSMLSGASGDGDIEALSKLKSLRAIAEWILSRAEGTEEIADNGVVKSRTALTDVAVPLLTATEVAVPLLAAPEPREVPKPELALPEPQEVVARMLLDVVELPSGGAERAAPPKGLIVITDDGQGVAPLLAEELNERGIANLVVRQNPVAGDDLTHSAVNLLDREAVAQFIEDARRQYGPVGGLIHLMPLADGELYRSPDFTVWQAVLDAELHSMLLLAQHLESDLRGNGAGSVLVATRLGGAFAGDGAGGSFWPGQGGVCGLVKTLAREWSEVSCQALDFELESPAKGIVEALLLELGARDGHTEVGHQRGRRKTLRPVFVSLEGRPINITLDRDSVVLITGGVRGITAGVAIELAEKFGCRLILAGRSPLPPDGESPETARLTAPQELKAALVEQCKKAGEQPTPALIKARYERVSQAREMRANLAAMRKAAAAIEYHAVDVTDDSAFGALIDDVYRRFGRLDGVIHGAGVIEDKLVGDKSLESFDRVLKPKVAGALTLAAKLRPGSLKFMFFFSSVSARYGNRGQADYAAANEVLNKLAVWLNARWPGRVASLNWGPWKTEGGMVSAELAKHFAKAGVQLISPPMGNKAFIDELLYGRKDEPEVIFGGPLSEIKPRADAAETSEGETTPVVATAAPLLSRGAAVVHKSDESFELLCEIDPAVHVYLSDHQLDGKPVLPMAVSLELLSEAAVANWPDLRLVAMRNLRVLRGVAFEDGAARTLRVKGAVKSRGEDGLEVALEIESAGERPQLHYAAVAEFRRDVAAPAKFQRLELAGSRPLPISVEAAYEKWLFHGPRFAGILEVDEVGEKGIIARLAPSSPANFFADARQGNWLIDPVVVDSGFQLVILWVRTYLDMTPLPAHLGYCHMFGPLSGADLRCEVSVRHEAGSPAVHTDLKFFDAGGKLLGWLEGMEFTCSKALNRLAAAGRN